MTIASTQNPHDKVQNICHPSASEATRRRANAANECLDWVRKEKRYRAENGFPNDLFSLADAAEFCRVSADRFRAICRLGLGPKPASQGLELYWLADLSEYIAGQPARDHQRDNWVGDAPFRSPLFFARSAELSASISQQIGEKPGLFLTVSLAKTQHVKNVKDLNQFLLMHAATRCRLLYDMVNEIVHGRGPYRTGKMATDGIVLPERLSSDSLRLEVPLHFHGLFIFDTDEETEQAKQKLAGRLKQKLSKAFGQDRYEKEVAADFCANNGIHTVNAAKHLSFDLEKINQDEMCRVSAYATKYIYDTITFAFVSMK